MTAMMVCKSDVLVEEAMYVQQGHVEYRKPPANTNYPVCIQQDPKNHMYIPCCDDTMIWPYLTRGMHSLVEWGKHIIYDLQKNPIPKMGRQMNTVLRNVSMQS